MADTSIVEAGQLLANAWLNHHTLEALPAELFPNDRSEAAAIQMAMASAIGEPVVGWKVAGVPGPMVGRVFKSSLYDLPCSLPAALSAHAPMIECEMGFELSADLPARSTAYGVDEIVRAVRLRFMVEIVGTRFTHGKHLPDDEADRLAIIADNSAGSALCIGPVLADWQDVSLLQIPIELHIDGGPPAPGSPAELRTEPLEIMLWLANELSERGIGLFAGQYVTTGSANVFQALRPGSQALVTFGDHASVALSMDAL
jgi:2-keto-4-pentenoate hydratase